MKLTIVLGLALLIMVHCIYGYTQEALNDEIVQLPGTSALKSKHFSGFLQLSSTKFVHYYYIESERNPATDSLIYWTNGGPGCSGMIGLFSEMGPWRPTSNTTLEENPYAWTSVANMVFLEQPVGVGFSYTLDDSLIKNFNDYRASVDNLAIVKLFLERFPELVDRDFYLSSESYGGHYIPHWTLQILNDPSDLKLKFRGYLLGNPYTSFASSSIAGINALWGLQLVPQPVWDYAVAGTCNLISHDAYFMSMYIPTCFNVMNTLMNYTAALNPYALDFDVCPLGNGISSSSKLHRLHSGSHQAKALQAAQRRSIEAVQALALSPQPLPLPARVDGFSLMGERSIALAKRLLQEMQNTAPSVAQVSPAASSRPSPRESTSTHNEDIEYHPCTQVNTIAYLNNPSVQSALHVDVLGRTRHWQPCNEAVNGHWSVNDFLADTTALYSKIFNHPAKRKDFKMLVYSGDSDGVCATVGTQYWIYSIQNAKVLSLFKPWSYIDHRYGRQQGGFLTLFTGSLAFATVHHAGHEVPAYQPQSSLELLQRYLNGSLYEVSPDDSSGEGAGNGTQQQGGGEALVVVVATLVVVVAIIAIGFCAASGPKQDREQDIDQAEEDATRT